ncbi:hypothetical protein [Flavihumibacter solisilvae]|uniref:Uncharacterized protein n=1 Tax=Flavihumibacter solisilvae TaxID=1349421 RepID=A0A0C1IT87_9BACT|nr:hypothetical protein [Flavihumibacter solisilvae]KIC93644.1 hypothetical protein OI18_15880 [Flavihumibacter solisilvae]
MKKLLLENPLLKICLLSLMLVLFSTPTHSRIYCAASGGGCPTKSAETEGKISESIPEVPSSPFVLLLSI